MFSTNIPFLQSNSGRLINYVSPTIIVMAIGLLGFFANVKIPLSCLKIVSLLSTSAFSVYLIHDNLFIRNHIIAKIHFVIRDFNIILLTLSIIGIVAAIFFSCIVVDKIRMGLFKIININRFSELADKFIKAKINKIYEKIRDKLRATAE